MEKEIFKRNSIDGIDFFQLSDIVASQLSAFFPKKNKKKLQLKYDEVFEFEKKEKKKQIILKKKSSSSSSVYSEENQENDLDFPRNQNFRDSLSDESEEQKHENKNYSFKNMKRLNNKITIDSSTSSNPDKEKIENKNNSIRSGKFPNIEIQKKIKNLIRDNLTSSEEEEKNQSTFKKYDSFSIPKTSAKLISDSEKTINIKHKKSKFVGKVKNSIEIIHIQDINNSNLLFGEDIEFQKILYEAIQNNRIEAQIMVKKQKLEKELTPCVVCLENDGCSDLKYTICCENPLHVKCMVQMLNFGREKCPICRKENIELKDSCLKPERKYENM